MIVSNRGRFVIATPVKNRTTSLEYVARREEKRSNGDGLRVAQPDVAAGRLPRGGRRYKHSMVVPPAFEDYKRYLLVRDPYARLASMYHFLNHASHYSQWGACEVQRRNWRGPHGDSGDPRLPLPGPPLSFTEFLQWLHEMREKAGSIEQINNRGEGDKAFRSPWIWTDTQLDSFALLSQAGQYNVEVIYAETMWEKLWRLSERHHLRLYRKAVHANSTGAVDVPAMWDRVGVRTAKNIDVADEARALRYVVRSRSA